MHKVNRSKVRTLCTIDTSDIDLQQGKNKTSTLIPASQKNNKNKQYVHNLHNSSHNYAVKNIHESKSKQKNGSSPLNKTKKASFKCGTPVGNVNKYMMNTYNGNRSPGTRHQAKNKSFLNNTVSRSKSRIKTEYSTVSDIVFKSILSKSSKSLKQKSQPNPLDQTYKMQTYQIIQQLSAPMGQKHYLSKHDNKLFLMKKTKDPCIKKKYEEQAIIKVALINAKNGKQCKIKWKNLEKLVKLYTERNWLYAIYQYSGSCLSWTNPAHMQMIEKVLKNQGAVLKHIIKQISKGLNQLSSRGYCHSRLRLQNIQMKLHQQKTIIKIQGIVKLCQLSKCFQIKQKSMLLNLSEDIYTPPQIINLKLFENKGKFDRELIQYISYYDQPWYVDVWGLGVLMLELIAGQAISIEKQADVSIQCGSSSQSNYDKQLQVSLKKNQQITLEDILQAQKSLLVQTGTLIQKVSFDKKLQSLLIRMLSINPLSRPSPRQIIKELQHFP